MKSTIKDKMYQVISKLFEKNLDGENKDGVFITIDGQQYNIKIVAKKEPVKFGAEVGFIKTAAPAIINIDWDEMMQKAIIEMFEEAVDYVQNP